MTKTFALVTLGAALVWYLCALTCFVTLGNPSRWAERVFAVAFAGNWVAGFVVVASLVLLVLAAVGVSISIGEV